MTYELAFKLKEAGFPQPEEPTIGHYDSWILQKTFGVAYAGSGENEIRLYPGMSYYRKSVYIPTLSELPEVLKRVGGIKGMTREAKTEDGLDALGEKIDKLMCFICGEIVDIEYEYGEYGSVSGAYPTCPNECEQQYEYLYEQNRLFISYATYHFLKICELHANGEDFNPYLEKLLSE